MRRSAPLKFILMPGVSMWIKSRRPTEPFVQTLVRCCFWRFPCTRRNEEYVMVRVGVRCADQGSRAAQLGALVEGLITATTECSLGVSLALSPPADEVLKIWLAQTYRDNWKYFYLRTPRAIRCLPKNTGRHGKINYGTHYSLFRKTRYQIIGQAEQWTDNNEIISWMF